MQPAPIPTPHIGHLTQDDYNHIYEPAEDSFILLDALELEQETLRQLQPTVCVEIGSGSGIVSTFLSTLLQPWTSFVTPTDINLRACAATLRTAELNQVTLDPIRCNLVEPLLPRLQGKIDLLVFNPPYVPTDEMELSQTQFAAAIGGAWAGGLDGMDVTERVLNMLPALLAPNGRLYLVAIEQNKPGAIIERHSLHGQIVLRRRAGREMLSVIRFSRESEESSR